MEDGTSYHYVDCGCELMLSYAYKDTFEERLK